MVTFNHKGRMGNFFSQCATAISYALQHGLEFHVPTTTNNKIWAPVYLSHLANPKFDSTLPEKLLNEHQHNYSELPFQEDWGPINIKLDGFFQSEKYFKQHRVEILNLFGFKWEHREGWVAFHIRRGDYVRLPTKHPVVTIEFITKAISYFTDKGYSKFAMFSDGMDWVKQNVNSTAYPDCEFEYNEKKENATENLLLGSFCEHQISSNGTYGWWMAWLNKNINKIVVAPHQDNYFGTDYKYLSTADIYPDDWIQIPYTPLYELPETEQLIYK